MFSMLCLKSIYFLLRICPKDIFKKKEKMKNNGKQIFKEAMKKLWKVEKKKKKTKGKPKKDKKKKKKEKKKKKKKKKD